MSIHKKRNFLTIIAFVIIFVLGPTVYFKFLRPKLTSAAWFNDQWGYRKAVAISNSSGSALSDFQVSVGVGTSVLISSGKMKSDCSDIRVTDINGKLLPHWIEGPCNTAANSATVWTKVPSIPTSGGTVYVYYGNPSATNTSSTTNTFIREISNVVGAWTFNEGVGTTANDYSGNSNTGTLGAGDSAPGWVTGMYGIGLSFDGSNDYAQIPSSSSLEPASQVTISAWFYSTFTSGEGDAVSMVYGSSGSGRAYGFRYLGTNANFLVRTVNSGQLAPANPYTIGQWRYLVGTYDGTSAKLYENGLLVDTKNGTGNIDYTFSTFISMGRKNSVDGSYWGGKIDELRVYSRALTQAEITDLYGTGGDKYGYVTTNYAGKELVRKYSSTAPSASSGQEEQSKAPVAYWKFDEGQGTTLFSTGSNNNGTMGAGSSAPTWQTEDMCVSGKCLKFDGSNDYVDAGNNSSLSPSNITISAWIKPNSVTGVNYRIVDKAYTSGQYAYQFYTGTSDSKLHFMTSTNGTTYSTLNGNTTLQTNTWYHVVALFDGTNRKIYINGRLDNSDTTASLNTNSTDNLNIGAVNKASNFNGFLDEVKIYPYARSAAEIKTDFQRTSASKGAAAKLGADQRNSAATSEGLVGYWKMDENIGTTTLDSSGNNNTATFGTGSSAPSWSAGMYGVGLSFDGVDDIVNTNLDVQPSAIPITTWSAWVKPTSSSGRRMIFTDDNGGYDRSVESSRDGDGKFNIFTGTTSWAPVVADLNQWQHIVIIWTSSNVYFYKNGVQYTYGNAPSGQATTLKFTIGSHGSDEYFSGQIDDVRIYNRALSPAEVRNLYNWAPGPVAYYNFNEGVGSSAFDTSGYGNNGVWSGTGTHWGTGKYGKAGKFNGSDDYVGISDSSTIDGFNTFTVAAWIHPVQQKLQTVTMKTSTGGGGAIYNIELRSEGTIRIHLHDTTDQNIIDISGSSYSLNQWTYLVFTFDNSTGKLYKNGVQVLSQGRSGSNNVNNSNNLLYIGANGGSDRFFNGFLDEVKIYPYARTQKQIVEDMNAGHPAVGSPVGSALAYYKFDEGYGTTTNNSGFGGSTLNGTLGAGTSAPSWTNNGKFGKALSFGGNDFIDVGSNSALDFERTDAFSISTWIKTSATGNYQDIFNKIQTSGNYQGYEFLIVNTNVIYFQIINTLSTNNIRVSGTKNVVDGNWHHVVATYNGSSLASGVKMYIDGVNESTSTVSDNLTATSKYNTTAKIGARTDLPFFNGLIDEVKIYNYALTEDEVKIDYNRGAALQLGTKSSGTGNTAPSTASSQEYCIPGDTASCSPPVAEWLFEENRGSSAYDTSGNGNTGTLGAGSSAPSWSPGYLNNGAGLRFDGIKQYINTVSFPFNSYSSITVSAWVKVLGSGNIIVTNHYGNSSYESVELSATSFTINSSNASGTRQTLSFTSIANNAWHYVVGVWSGTNLYVYVDGKLNAGPQSATNPPWNTSVTISIGARRDLITGVQAGSQVTGLLDQVRIYNYARTPAQIAWDYNKGKPVAWYKFDECQGNVTNSTNETNTPSLAGTINIGASGTQTVLGTCAVGTGSTAAWGNGSSGKYNASLNFDGTDDYIQINDTTNSVFDSLTNEMSVALWYKYGGKADDWVKLINKMADFSPPYDLWDFNHDANAEGSQKLAFNISDNVSGGSTGTSGYSKTTLQVGSWYFVVGTYSKTEGKIRIYINGIKENEGSANLTIGVNNQPVRIGTWNSSQQFVKGQIDDVKIFNYALTSEQVKLLYNQGSSVRFGPSSGNP